MITTRRVGLSLAMMALAGALWGCGGDPGMGPRAPMAEAASAGKSWGPGDAPAQAGQPPPPPEAPGMPMGDAAGGRAYQAPKASEAPAPPQDRPGLGTQWGETRTSRISTVAFVRADAATPFATSSLFYNDEEGARAMTSSNGFRRTASGSYPIANGLASIGLRGEGGTWLSGFVSGGRNYTIGESGRRYSIVVKNNSDFRLEVVLSVDGLDVLDGKPAAFNKRGYLIDPHSSVEVEGFRQSADAVAAFRFGSVRGSYAGQKHGDTRNVGVIGVALFHERGTNPWTQQEINRRNDANPFPGQYATPP